MSTVKSAAMELSRRSLLKLALAGLFVPVAASVAAAVKPAVADTAAKSDAADTASTDAAETRTVTDMAGNEVEIPAKVTRYADSWFAHNEVICMLDQANGLVATVMTPEKYPWMYYTQPNMYNALSTFGDDFNVEELVALQPDVVFASNDDLVDTLKPVGIPVVNVMFKNYDEMKKSITLTADILGGDAPAIAEKYVEYLDGVLADLQEKTATLDEADLPSVLHGTTVYGLKADGSNTIIDAWITAAGGTNAASEIDGNMKDVTIEQVMLWDADYIITGNPSDVDSIMNDDAWAGLTAVQNGQVFVNPAGVFSWDRYGIEGALQLQWAANLLHPDLFDYDIETIVKDFYKEFLNYELTDDEVQMILNAEKPTLEDKTGAAETADTAETADSKEKADAK